MEVYRRSSWLLLLLGLSLLATTLQGVQGEAESEGPSESECRPYIEKALKELETGEAVEQKESIDDGSKEDVPTVEITDDSDHDVGDGDNEADVEGKASTEIVEHDETTEADETVDEQADEAKSSEDEITEKSDEATEEKQEESGEHHTEEEHDDVAFEEQASSHEESVETQEEPQEEQAEDVDKKESQEEADSSDNTESFEESAVSHEQVESHEQPESHEESEKEQVGSQEQTEEHEQSESHEQSELHDQADEHAESQEQAETEHAESQEEAETEEHAESQEQAESLEHTESQEQAESQEHTESLEHAESQEQVESQEHVEPVEHAESQEAESQEHAETQEHAESQEHAEEQVESHEDEAKVEHKESEEKQESVETEEHKSGEEEEVKQSEEIKEKDVSEEVKEEIVDESTSAKKTEEEQADEGKSHEQSTETEQDSKSEEHGSVAGDESDDTKREKREAEVEEIVKDGEKDAVDDKGGEEDAEGDGTESDEKAKDTEESESAPEEDLSEDIEIPEDLKPRDHIDQLLKLDDSSAEVEAIINRASAITLRELKKLYENAIQPLEVLYKYRDLSNRHFGDSEIFSKPLVLFMGPWSGGKSTIINYLLNNEYNETTLRTGITSCQLAIFSTSSAEPSPAYFNILLHGEEPEIVEGTQLAADFTFSGLQKFGQGLEERLRGLKLPNKLLEKINLVEIPGILEVRKQVSRVFPFNDACQWFIDRADIIFLVYDPSKLDVGPETEAILDQLKGREYQTRIILNKADQVKPEELMRVQGALIWNISPLMSSAQPPVMYTTSLWSRPYEPGAPTRLLQAQERAFLRDLRSAIDKRIENKISSARRFAVRVRNHAKMVDCYLTTYYNHKSVFGNRKQISDQIIDNPQNYHIYEGLSTLTNISRYDLPDPDVYRDFFKLNPLYDFQQLSSTCTYFRGCPINRLDVAIAYDLPELVGKHRRLVETALAEANLSQTPGS